MLFMDYRGLKVKDMQALRAQLREKGADMHVVKNTLLRIAMGSDTENLPYELHNGPTAVAFLKGNEPDCAKILVDYKKQNKKLEIKGGFLSGKALSDEQVVDLSKLPPREVLIAQVIGVIAAPISNVIAAVEAIYAEPVRTIGAVADKAAENN